jgi:sugar/nucleoside kinase (ribokinase family)
MERKGVIAAGNMLVDHVHQIVQWPERGWLAEITQSERSTGGAPLNVLLTLAKMRTGMPLQAVGLVGEDSDGDYIMAMLDQYHVNRQHVQRTNSAPTSMSQVMTDPTGNAPSSTPRRQPSSGSPGIQQPGPDHENLPSRLSVAARQP